MALGCMGVAGGDMWRASSSHGSARPLVDATQAGDALLLAHVDGLEEQLAHRGRRGVVAHRGVVAARDEHVEDGLRLAVVAREDAERAAVGRVGDGGQVADERLAAQDDALERTWLWSHPPIIPVPHLLHTLSPIPYPSPPPSPSECGCLTPFPPHPP